jgi:hypothetical protein
MNPKTSDMAGYETPELVAIGNLRDVLAGSTRFLNCDSLNNTPGGDGDVTLPPAQCLAG